MTVADTVPASTVDDTWQRLAHFVGDHRGAWKRAATERTGLAFNHIRLLRRIGAAPRSVTDLADAVGIDAPAASVGVTFLERRGLVVREVDPCNRRRKIVTLTSEGHTVLARAMAAPDPAPSAFAALSDDDVAALTRIVTALVQADEQQSPASQGDR